MAKNESTSAIIDGILKIAALGGLVGTTLIAPGMARVLDKPYVKLWKRLNKREREREIKRITYYMKTRGLIKGNYDHGIQITPKGRDRLFKLKAEHIRITIPRKWDGKWRIIFYDIPEKHKNGRDALAAKLKQLNFYGLQRSVMVHPYPCREEIAALCELYNITGYVSYIETDHIDRQDELKRKFKMIFSHTI